MRIWKKYTDIFLLICMILGVSCVYQNKDCHKSTLGSNPMDDFTVLVLYKCLNDIKSELIRRTHHHRGRLSRWYDRVSEHLTNRYTSLQLTSQDIDKIHTIANKIENLSSKKFPDIEILTQDYYRDFSLVIRGQTV